MRVFRTLYGQLAAVLLLLSGLMVASFIVVGRYATEMYRQEVAQKLNRDLAEHIVAERLPFRGGAADQEALADIFHMLMVINPAIEVYLLDVEGRVLAFSAPPERVHRRQVDLTPVRRFLDGPSDSPILGDDPRSPSRRKVFSAAAVPPDGPLEGYVYVILGGEAYDSIAAMLRDSYIMRTSAWTLLASTALALVAGLGLFGLLTRRLRRLSRAMDGFRDGDLSSASRLPSASADGDEIDRLADTFRRMAERIAEQLRRLKQTDALRRELVANVSHDLRTPLASLQGYVETLLLKNDTLAADVRLDYLRVAARQSTRLGKLVSDLFELAKLDSSERRPRCEPFSIGELIQDLSQKFHLRAENERVTLEADFGPHLPFVSADIPLIERVLENLIDNALRHTDAGGRVRVTVRPNGDTVTVEVSDTGAGIPADALPNIFDRHYQLESSHRDRSGRAGLGLAIAKRILELHGSAIEARSTPDVGTTFAFHLPIAAGVA